MRTEPFVFRRKGRPHHLKRGSIRGVWEWCRCVGGREYVGAVCPLRQQSTRTNQLFILQTNYITSYRYSLQMIYNNNNNNIILSILTTQQLGRKQSL